MIKKAKIKIGGVVKELGYDAEKLDGKQASDFVLASDPRLTDTRVPKTHPHNIGEINELNNWMINLENTKADKSILEEVSNDVLALENNKADKLELQAVASGSPKGVYPTFVDLETAFPTGNSNIYITTDNGHWNYWNGAAWVSGGVYQARVGDKSEIGFNSPQQFINFEFDDFEIRGNTSLLASEEINDIASWYVNETLKNEIIDGVLHKKVGRYIFNGTENWTRSSGVNFRTDTPPEVDLRVRSYASRNTVRDDVRFNLYAVDTAQNILDKINDKVATINESGLGEGLKRVYVRDEEFDPDPNAFKSHLQADNLIMYYELTTEELIPLVEYVKNPIIKIEDRNSQILEIEVLETLKANEDGTLYDYIDKDLMYHQRIGVPEEVIRPANLGLSEIVVFTKDIILYLESDTSTLPILVAKYEPFYNILLREEITNKADKAIVERLELDVFDIKERVDVLEDAIEDIGTTDGVYLKPFVIPTLEEARLKTINDNGFNFIVATDTHHQTYIKHMFDVIITYEKNYGNIDLVMHHGDIVEGGKDILQHKLELLENVKQLQKINKPFVIAMGNHDVNKPFDVNNLMEGYMWRNVVLKPFENRVKFNYDETNYNSTYYFTDFEQQKIRVITLECYDRMFDFGFSAELVNWLGKTALNFSSKGADKPNWAVIIQSHMPTREEVNYYTGAIRYSSEIENVLKSFVLGTTYTSSIVDVDFISQGQMEVIMFLNGHGHCDIMHKPTDLYWHYVMTANGHHIERVTAPTSPYATIPDKIVGTINEFAVDIFNVDRVNRKVKITRIGAGSDREFNY